MAELAKINLSGPVYDPRSTAPKQDMSDKIRQGRQDALNQSIQRAKAAHMKFQMKQATDMEKSQEFLAENASSIFNTKANALDPSTWKFTQPGAREKFYKQWKSEVGGNWAGFQAAYSAAKEAEMRAMQKNLMIGRNAINPDGSRKFKTDKQYQKHFSKMLDALPPEQRQQLLSQSSPEMYSQIQSMYLSKDKREFIFNPLNPDSDLRDWAEPMIGESYAEEVVGLAGAAGLALAARKQPKKIWDAIKRKFGKGSGGSGGGGDEILQLTDGGRGGGGIPMAGGSVPLLNAVNKVPGNKVPVLMADIKAKVKTGSLSPKEGSWLQAQLRNASKDGGAIDMTEINGIFQQSKTGRGIIDKAKNWGGALGAIGMGAAVGEQAGSTLGEKAGGIGAIAGAHLLPGMYKTAKGAIDRKGAKWVFNKIMAKGGPSLVARTIGKVGLGSISGLFSGGMGALLTAGWLAADVAMIHSILQESEEAGEF